jgi:phosphoglycerate kinase
MKNFDKGNLFNKKILVRVDLNIPVVDGKITEKSRIQIIKKTITKLQKQKNKIFLLSHFGRPKGKKDDKYSLKFICKVLEKEFKINKIFFLENFNDNKIQDVIKEMSPSDICLFENIRFFPEEENNDLNFIKLISRHFDAYINDAFSVSHRNHASTVGITKFLPSFAGYSLINEIKNINQFILHPKKPNLAIIGGSKISTKIDLLDSLCERFDAIFIGGAMANTFLYAKKINIGKSLYEKNLSEVALLILEKGKKLNCEIILPLDVVCSNDLNNKNSIRKCNVNDILENQMVLDVGSKTIEKISKYILKSNMVLWNGPLGCFEVPPFEKSSFDVAKMIKKSAKNLDITTLAGGGDTVSVIKSANAEEGFSYISQAGGAFLEWLEGRGSPGVNALTDD